MSFIKYLKDVPGIKHILGVDIETIPLMCSSQLLGSDSYAARRENPLKVTVSILDKYHTDLKFWYYFV